MERGLLTLGINRAGSIDGKASTMTTDQEPLDSPQGWVTDHVRRYIETNGEDGQAKTDRQIPLVILEHA